ncbi:hypothetical protein [Prevotella falsenii]|nr:hypothetical protein [Prevotella falsenii]
MSVKNIYNSIALFLSTKQEEIFLFMEWSGDTISRIPNPCFSDSALLFYS